MCIVKSPFNGVLLLTGIIIPWYLNDLRVSRNTFFGLGSVVNFFPFKDVVDLIQTHTDLRKPLGTAVINSIMTDKASIQILCPSPAGSLYEITSFGEMELDFMTQNLWGGQSFTTLKVDQGTL